MGREHGEHKCDKARRCSRLVWPLGDRKRDMLQLQVAVLVGTILQDLRDGRRGVLLDTGSVLLPAGGGSPAPALAPDPRASGGPPGSCSRAASAIGWELLLVWSLPRSSPAALPRCRWRLLERAFPKVGGRRRTFTETPRHSTGVADGPTTILRDPSSD